MVIVHFNGMVIGAVCTKICLRLEHLNHTKIANWSLFFLVFGFYGFSRFYIALAYFIFRFSGAGA